MRVRHFRGIRITTDLGREITAEQIGKGRWTTAYRDTGNADVVYLFVRRRQDGTTDYSKEILVEHAETVNVHLPQIERMDDIDGAEDQWNVYRTRYYTPLTAKSKEAWRQFRAISRILQDEWKSFSVKLYARKAQGYEFMEAVVGRARSSAEVPTSLANALGVLQSACMNYGADWRFEFAKRNLAVGADGNLVLLDAIYDAEQLKREMSARQARGRAA